MKWGVGKNNFAGCSSSRSKSVFTKLHVAWFSQKWSTSTLSLDDSFWEICDSKFHTAVGYYRHSSINRKKIIKLPSTKRCNFRKKI